jgi:hypothetical protein
VASKSPQQTITELKDLVVAYFQQEAIDPLKNLGRYLALGVAGGFLLVLAVFCSAIALLRVLQTETGDTFTNNWSWVPYVIVSVALAVTGAAFWWFRARKGSTQL